MPCKVTLTSLLLATAAITPAVAQSVDTITANVPFAFQVGSQSFAPGEYTFQQRLVNGALTIRGGRRIAAVVLSLPGTAIREAANDSKLVFERREGQLYLSQVDMGGTPAYLLSTPPLVVSHTVAGSTTALR